MDLPLKHARTDAHFNSSNGAIMSDSKVPQRFDSHNLHRCSEAADLMGKTDEEIWLRQENGGAVVELHQVKSVPELDEEEEEEVVTAKTAPITPVIRNGHLAVPSSSTLPGKLSDIVEHPYNVDLDAETPAESCNQDDGTSVHSSIPSQSVSNKKPHKSLTRRLSGFLSRSFRRKKRTSAVYSENRPDSSTTQRSEEYYANENRQQMLRLGFSLDIEEALKNEPDSFLFVPLTDSGYFSSSFEEIEKLPQEEEAAEKESDDVETFPTNASNAAAERRANLMNRRLSFVEGTSVMELVTNPHYSLSTEYLGHPRPAKQKLKFKKHPWKWIKSKF